MAQNVANNNNNASIYSDNNDNTNSKNSTVSNIVCSATSAIAINILSNSNCDLDNNKLSSNNININSSNSDNNLNTCSNSITCISNNDTDKSSHKPECRKIFSSNEVINVKKNMSLDDATSTAAVNPMQNLDDFMEYEVTTFNKFSNLPISNSDSVAYPLKKSKSSTSIEEEARFDEINALRLQLLKMQEDYGILQKNHIDNMNKLKLQIDSLNSSVALEDDSGFTKVVSPSKGKRKTLRKRASNVSVDNIHSSLDDIAVVPPKPTGAIPKAQPVTFSPAPTAGTSAGTSRVFQPIRRSMAKIAVSAANSRVSDPLNASTSQSAAATVAQSLSGPVSSGKFPPFFIYNINYRNFVNLFPNLKFKMQIVNSNLKKFFVYNFDDYMLVREKLEANDSINFFTYTPKDVKPITYIIRGLDSSFTVEEISSGIKALFPNINIVKVDIFSTTFSRRVGKDTNLWIIQLAPGSNVPEFRKLRYFLNSVVSVEPIKSGGVVQCKKCQRYDHIAINCGMPFRCVKCGKSHLPGECLASEPSSLTCANCGGNHTANYGGCPRRTARSGLAGPAHGAVHVINNSSVISPANFPALPSGRPQRNSMPVTSNLSYANAISNANSRSNNSNSSPIGLLHAEINSLFGCSLSAIINKFQAFIPKYSHTLDINEKKMLLLEFLFDIVSNGV